MSKISHETMKSWFVLKCGQESRPKRNTNQDIQLYEDQVNKMKEETKAKLQQSLQDLNAELSQLKQDHKYDIEPLNKQIRSLQVVVHIKEKHHNVHIDNLEMKIKAAQKDLCRFERTSPSPSLDKEFECPICLEMMGPPRQIYQCPSGHLICGDCKTRGTFVSCHVCRTPLGGLGNFTRNRPMERIIQTYLQEK